MKALGKYAAALCGAAFLLAGCASSLTTASSAGNTDDLYATGGRKAIAAAESERQARLAAQREQRALRDIEAAGRDGRYQGSVLSDSYQESYERRLKGFNSLSYKLPSSYYDYVYSDAAWNASGYDPAFYNTIVMGDQVWVEPRYITSMFGNWGTPVNVNVNLGWNWYSPYWDWYYRPGWNPYWSWNWGWDWGWNWGPSWSWGWGWRPYWDYPYWGWGGHINHWYPSGGRYNDRNVVYGGRRPSMTRSPVYGTGGSGTTVNGYRRRGSSTVPSSVGTGNYPSQGTTYQRRGSSGNTSRPTYTPPQNNNNSTPTYQRRGSSTPSYNSGGSYGGSRGGSYGGGGGGSSSGGGGYRRR